MRSQRRARRARCDCHRAYDALLEARETLDEVVEQAICEQSFSPLEGLFARVEAAEARFREAMIRVRLTEAMASQIG